MPMQIMTSHHHHAKSQLVKYLLYRRQNTEVTTFEKKSSASTYCIHSILVKQNIFCNRVLTDADCKVEG
jgi:hypothetical protein